MTRSIGGPVHLDQLATLIGTGADYARRAQLHRPADPDAIACECRRLHASGLSALDIAGALHLDSATVINVLALPRSIAVSEV